MSDVLKNREPADRSHVNVNEPAELKYWCRKFGCTEQQLRQAIATVGGSAAKITQHFKSKSRPADRRKIGFD